MAFITDKQREQCVMNNNHLYRSWTFTTQTIQVFVRHNRKAIDTIIKQDMAGSWKRYDERKN